MWLMENWRDVDKYNIEIVGSDIDTRALKAAAEGIYGERALMRLSRDVVGRYFKRWRRQSSTRSIPGCGNRCSSPRANLIDAPRHARSTVTSTSCSVETY